MAKRKPKAPTPPKRKPSIDARARDAYREKREKAGARERAKAAAGKEISPAPPPKDMKRRLKALADPEFYLREYHPRTFSRPFCKAHKIIIRDCAETMEHGGNEARAIWRGGGKTSIFCGMAEWGIAKGLRRYPVALGATALQSRNILTSIKNELQFNDHLNDDFPDLCFCFRALEGMAARCRGQTYGGQKTGVLWEANRIVWGYLPDPDGNPYPCSGAVFQVASLFAAARGMYYLGVDGVRMRPDFCLLDDPQTDRSARSRDQCNFRETLIRQAMLGLAGGDKIMSAFAAMTPIAPDDLAERLLDPDKFPEWQGRRFPLVTKWPTAINLWDEYNDKLAVGYRNGDKSGKDATKFYRKNKKAMAAGADVADPYFFAPSEVDALEHAMRLKFKDPDGFPAEYLMEPRQEKSQTADLTVADLWHRVSGIARGRVPMATQAITAFIDVQHTALYWAVSAFGPNLGGSVIDYGTWPDQNRVYFSLKEISRTLAKHYPGHALEAGIRAGLVDLLNLLFSRAWQGEDGVDHRLAFCLIDSSEGRVSDVIHEVCRTHQIAAGRCLPSVGKGIGATDQAMTFWRVGPGERKGDHWILRRSSTKGGSRNVVIDVNFWKSFTADRLRLPHGDRGALLLPGQKPGENRMLCDHLVSETRAVMTNEKTGSQCEIWRWKPNRPDNHFWDCVVGTCVAASMTGLSIVPPAISPPPGSSSQNVQPRERVKPIVL